MKVTVERTTATEVDIAGYHSVTVVAPASLTPRHNARPVRRNRAPRRRTRIGADGMVEVQLVRSSRNRLGGGARARPAATSF